MGLRKSSCRRQAVNVLVVILPLSVGRAEECGGVAVAASEIDCNRNGVADDCDLARRHLALVPYAALVAGGFPQAQLAADLDGDAHVDLAQTTLQPRGLSVAWAIGERGLTGVQDLAFLGHPTSLYAVDLDGDGLSELVIPGPGDDLIGIVPNPGQRRFGEPVAVSVARVGSSLAAADLDGDGRLDLAVGLRWPEEAVRVLLHEPTGSFAFREGPSLAAGSGGIVAADVDRDGDVDLLSAALVCGGEPCNRIFLALNEGPAAFSAPQPLDPLLGFSPAGALPGAADLTGDGALDLVIWDGQALQLLRHAGDGPAVFEAPEALPVEGGFQSLELADLDGDADIDLAPLVGEAGDTAVLGLLRKKPGIAPYLNDGAGGFLAGPALPLPDQTFGFTLADVDGDRDADAVAMLREDRLMHFFHQAPYATSQDCDADGVPDECQDPPPRSECQDPGGPLPCERDCNANFVADRCEVVHGPLTDCNANGVPDDCEAAPTFILRFAGPASLEGGSGSTVAAGFTIELSTCGLPFGATGPQGWVVLATCPGARLKDPTTAGTIAAPWPAGLRREGFEKSIAFQSSDCGAGVVTAVVLSFAEDVNLPADPAPRPILSFTFEATVPEGEASRLTLTIPATCRDFRESMGDGAGAHSPPSTSVTYLGDTVTPSVQDHVLRLGSLRFRRGDANADARVDISDAIRTFMYLFLGAAPPRCLDAVDANDDGRVDISDGLHTLNDFFREHTAIPAPGPFACGIDPAPDRLGCNAYEVCDD